MEAICLNCEIEFTYGHSKTGKYCSNKCCGEHKAQLATDRSRKLFEVGKLTLRKRIKKFIIERDGYECNTCKLDDWQGKPITLWLDHIDGDATNNDPKNFRLLCPNCDSQSDTFGSKNMGRGRKSRGLPQYG